MTTMQGTEQTPVGTVPGVRPSENAAINLQLWKASTKKFLKGEPKVLGVVQVMIALIILSLGMIVRNAVFPEPIFSVFLWAPVWGPTMFIISGSLATVAGVRTTKHLVIGSLWVNTISSVVAAATSVISGISVFVTAYRPFSKVFVGLDALMFILNVLEFCITVSVSAFGCKTSCCTSHEVVIFLPSNPDMATAAPPTQLQPLVPPPYQEINVPENLYKNTTGERRVQF